MGVSKKKNEVSLLEQGDLNHIGGEDDNILGRCVFHDGIACLNPAAEATF
jgi:hypothetical protein